MGLGSARPTVVRPKDLVDMQGTECGSEEALPSLKGLRMEHHDSMKHL